MIWFFSKFILSDFHAGWPGDFTDWKIVSQGVSVILSYFFILSKTWNFQFEEKKALKLESSLSNSTHLAAHFGHSLNKNTHSSRAKPNVA